nr:C2 calcium-dependent membrane targeting [Tanacetum cinerariifolium]
MTLASIATPATATLCQPKPRPKMPHRSSENVGKSQVDAAGCQTVILSESFLREIYDGQLFVKVNKGYDFPAMDPWGTSDPYVVLQLDSQVVKSKTKWGTKEPTWNEELTLYIKLPPTNSLQVAAWDANLVSPPKRMGNSSVNLESICDGEFSFFLIPIENVGKSQVDAAGCQTVILSEDGDADPVSKWHVFVTGHSLGGALATLLALELSSSQLAKRGAISVTMYNFGSPRVGNKLFAQVYNEKVKDSWRVVNHRDIIPSVPRLMGYCHVAHPIYLAAGDVENALENIELLGDGYEGDVIGEYTPDDLVNEFMKGEKELIEKILNTEINIFLLE